MRETLFEPRADSRVPMSVRFGGRSRWSWLFFYFVYRDHSTRFETRSTFVLAKLEARQI